MEWEEGGELTLTVCVEWEEGGEPSMEIAGLEDERV